MSVSPRTRGRGRQGKARIRSRQRKKKKKKKKNSNNNSGSNATTLATALTGHKERTQKTRNTVMTKSMKVEMATATLIRQITCRQIVVVCSSIRSGADLRPMIWILTTLIGRFQEFFMPPAGNQPWSQSSQFQHRRPVLHRSLGALGGSRVAEER